MMRLVPLLACLLLAVPGWALQNGLAQLPPMGYNTWYDFKCTIKSQDLKAAADAILRQGLDKIGYKYVNIDDCWALGRSPNGTLQPDPKAFPDGISPVVSYVHSKGLLFGIYTDRGSKTCKGRPGSLNYEKIDARTFAEWGVDFVKEDSCYAPDEPKTAFEQYGKMRDALNATGRKILFSLCGVHSWYALEGAKYGNMWRISQDCSNWGRVLLAINTMAQLSRFSGPGGWNDPDMLLGSSNHSSVSLLPHQSRSMFSLWCILSAPLLIGSNIVALSPWDLATYSNTRLIAVNQDPSAVQGQRVAGKDLVTNNAPGLDHTTWNVWSKPLASGARAVHFINVASDSQQSVSCDAICMTRAGMTRSAYDIVDLWTMQKVGTTTPQHGWTVQDLPANGGSQTLLFVPQH